MQLPKFLGAAAVFLSSVAGWLARRPGGQGGVSTEEAAALRTSLGELDDSIHQLIGAIERDKDVMGRLALAVDKVVEVSVKLAGAADLTAEQLRSMGVRVEEIDRRGGDTLHQLARISAVVDSIAERQRRGRKEDGFE